MPLETTVLLSTSVTLTVLDSSYRWIMQYFTFCYWLISLRILPFRFIHVFINGRISFFFLKGWIYSILCIPHFCIHSFANGHLGCFCILATMYNSAVTLGVQISFQDLFPLLLDTDPKVEFMAILCSIFLETTTLFFMMATLLFYF